MNGVVGLEKRGASPLVKTGVARFLVFILMCSMLGTNALALTATQSPSNCTNNAGIGTVAWTNPTLAFASDNAYAQAIVGGNVSQYLFCTGYAFAIPTGAIIQGIAVNVERRSDRTQNGGSNDAAVRLIKGGAIGTADRSRATSYTISDFVEAHGSSADLWGTTWTSTDINAANFGVAFAATKPDSNGQSHVVSVDHIQVVVTYAIPATVVSINRSSADPTSAARVSWTVTFDQSVTGADSTAFALAASGLNGAYIAAVTGSGATWTVTANTGIGAGTLGLNQTGPGSVIPTLSGTFTGQIYSISATPALAEYRMDEASWNGTANEVVDSSGSGNHAQAFNSANTANVSPAISGNPGTCRYGVFDNGGAITRGYVQTPLPNLTTDFTVTAWIRTTNNTVSGQRILIDDQGTTPGTGYGFSLADGTTGILRFYSRNINPVILDSTYTIANNTWYFVAAVADITNRRRTIYVFNATGALLASTPDPTAFTGTWGTDGGPVSIGAETNASGESPASFHFRGNLDEVRVYQKVLNQFALAAIATQSRACTSAGPHHLEIQHGSGTGLTCAASTLTIKACADAACTTAYTGGVSGTLTATGTPTVNWDGISGGATGAGFVIAAGASTVTKNLQVATAGTVVMGASGLSPVASSASTCNFGSPTCTFTASAAGFIYSNTTTGSSYTIPAQVAGIATPALYLRAVQASTTNPAVCTPAIIGQTTAVIMGYVCNNPAVCQAGNLATITNTTTSTATAIAPSGTSVSLNFDANGSAPLTARYDDVGQITLNANKTVTPFGGASAVALNGSSNALVVAPHHFGFSGITAAPIKAGTNFSATVTSYNSLATPTATGNFGKETAAEGVTLSFAKYQPTGAGAVNGSFSGSVGAFNLGVASAANLNWSEVGTIDLTATLASGSYLGSGLTTTGNTGSTGAVGRFIPDHFDTVVTQGCAAGAFTYSGQPFTLQVTAMNAAATPAKTVNYDGSANTSPNFAKALTLSDASAAGVGSLAPAAVAASAFTGGVAAPTPAYTFTTPTTAPTTIALRAVDTDSVTSSGHAEGTAAIRSGRLRLLNVYGSELLSLALNPRLQYWTGTGWQTNSIDTCTTIVPANFAFSFPTGTLVACNTAVTAVSGAAPNYTATLAAPGAAHPGSADITLNLGATPAGNQCSVVGGAGGAATTVSAPWLQYNWSGSVGNPTARATFGIYKSGPNIYRREVY